MARRNDDSVVWIGYVDFLTTLVVLFFIVTAVVMKKNPGGQITVEAEVDSASAKRGCQPVFQGKGGSSEGPALSAPSLQEALRMARFGFACDSLSRLDSVNTRLDGNVLRVTMQLTRQQSAGAVAVTGQANFARNSGKLTPEGRQRVLDSGREIQKALTPGAVIAVQGHADDLNFGDEDVRNNLSLSGERAADAAHQLVKNGIVTRCQVVSMGYGSSWPRERVLPTDGPAERERKREVNRRIEFRIVESPLTETPCPP